jgi:hypothetical protein
MVYAKSKEGIRRILVYDKNVLLVDKDDEITFIINNEYLDYTLRFRFTDKGEKYSTNVWEDKKEKLLLYQLNNWDADTWVEISKPVLLDVPDKIGKFWLKFRNVSSENKSYRNFIISIWKEVPND